MHNETAAGNPAEPVLDVKKILMIAIALVGILASSYLLMIHYLPASRSSILFRICSAGVFNCDRVNTGGYSVFLGFPLAGYGLAFYVLALFISLLREIAGDDTKNALAALLLWMTGAAALSVVPLFIVSTFLVRSFCLYCIVAWICNAALFAVAYRQATGGGATLAGIHREAWEFLRDFNRNFFPLLTIMASAALVALGVMFVSAALRQQRDISNIRENARMEERAMDDYARSRPAPLDLAGLPVYYGDPRAKVTVLEFFNFDCGVCRTASTVIKSIVDRYPGKVKLYLKNYPLDGTCNRHVEGKGDALTCKASIISVALQKSAHYAAYVNHIMSGRESLSREVIVRALGKINVDAKMLSGYMDERTAERILTAQVEEGFSLGVQGTPTFVINGKALPSGLPPARFLDRLIRLEIDKAYGTK